MTALIACGSPDQTTDADVMTLSSASILSSSCSGCHQANNEAIPDITGLGSAELYQAMLAYKNDEAGPTSMHRIIRGYDDAEIRIIADYIGASGE